MAEKMYKIINGIRMELTEQEYLEYNQEQNITVNLEKIKENKVRELKYNCSSYIYSIYPQFKQINITNGVNCTEKDLLDMKTFITNQINICNTKENEINNCFTKEEIELINIDFI